MNFRPELAAQVLAGAKTQTRRPTTMSPRSPWYEGGCSLTPGRTYAVCPGRGKPAVGRVRVTAVRREALGAITEDDARREGFESRAAFLDYWRAMHGDVDPAQPVWVVEFVALIAACTQFARKLQAGRA